MGATDKIRNKTEQLSGELKHKVGSATHNRDLQVEGYVQKVRANLKQVAEKAKDAFRR